MICRFIAVLQYTTAGFWYCPPARLETRTKESNLYASALVIETNARTERDSGAMTIELCSIIRTGFDCVLKQSIYVGTRKMVNYACIG